MDFLLSETASANLTVIGTAIYQGSNYDLIYMDSGPFGPVTWLDYTKNGDDWNNQVVWASGLGSQLSVSLNTGYKSHVDWNTGWRLPNSSEMRYLNYQALGNKVDGFLDKKGNFKNLQGHFYWSGTEYSPFPDIAWYFYFGFGNQGTGDKDSRHCALAVLPGEISAVPIPVASYLFASGLHALAGGRILKR